MSDKLSQFPGTKGFLYVLFYTKFINRVAKISIVGKNTFGFSQCPMKTKLISKDSRCEIIKVVTPLLF